MAIYTVNGNLINNAYDVNGNNLIQAYDINGNPLLIDGVDITVMSYNVQSFTDLNGNQSMQETILNTYDADIIGFQEMTQRNVMPDIATALLVDYPYTYLGEQGTKTAFASKYALSNYSFTAFQNVSTGARGYQKAYFTVDDKTICWINTHLATSQEETYKVAQAQEIFNAVQNELYFIITGDFNTGCESTAEEEYTTIMKQFIDAGYHSANCSNQHGFIGTWTNGTTADSHFEPTDHIITSANIYIRNVIADTTKIDVAAQTGQTIDHLPLIAFLTIT